MLNRMSVFFIIREKGPKGKVFSITMTPASHNPMGGRPQKRPWFHPRAFLFSEKRADVY